MLSIGLFCSVWKMTQATLEKRETVHRLHEKYAPDASVFTDDKVEMMFKLGYEQAENPARLIKGHDL